MATREFEATAQRYKPALEAYKKTTVIQDLTSLQGKVVVVTGGSRGIGLAFTRGVIEAGGDVAVIGQSPQGNDELWQCQEARAGSSLRYYSANIGDPVSLQHAFEQIFRDFGRIDGLIANAAITMVKPFLDHTYEDFVNLHQVNSIGAILCVQHAVRHMLRNSSPDEQSAVGSVVLVGTIATTTHCESQGLSGYSASKGSAKGMLHGLSVELAPLGIRVNMLSPGHTATDMAVNQYKDHPELEKIMRDAVPMHRLGQTRDMRGAAVYFLSDASQYTTGSELVISGGLHAGRL